MNITLFYFLHSIAYIYPWLDRVLWFLAEPFIYIVITSVTLVLVWQEKIFTLGSSVWEMWNKGRGVVVVCISTISGYILANLLKIIIHTDRPPIALPDVHSLVSETGYAFPSGHSATIAAFAFAVFFKNRTLGYVSFVAMLLVGVARVAAGVHFPIDIVGGYVLGFMVAYFLKSR